MSQIVIIKKCKYQKIQISKSQEIMLNSFLDYFNAQGMFFGFIGGD